MKTRIVFGLAITVGLVAVANGQPVVDGTLAGDQSAYGSALFIQNTLTSFGDNVNASAKDSTQGSEINGVYATIANGRLYLLLTGNLETANQPEGVGGSWNKMEIFIDSVAGGWNTIPLDAKTNGGSVFGNELPEVDPWSRDGGPSGNGALQSMANNFEGTPKGLTFDAGFEADHYITFSNGYETEQTSGNFAQEWAVTAHYAPLGTLASFGGTVPDSPTAEWGAVGGNTQAGVGTLMDKNSPIVNDFDNFWTERDTDNSVVQMEAALDNSNIAGIVGSGGPDYAATPEQMAAAAAVLTGIELSIPLSVLGNPTGDIKISAFINGGAHDYVSNQITGGALQGSLGGDMNGNWNDNVGGIDFSLLAGDQFVVLSQTAFDEADFDQDGDVDGDDFLAWQGGFGTTSGALKSEGDYDNDGDVDGDDFLGWQSEFGSGGGSGAIPEPSTTLLMVLAATTATLAMRRR